MEKTTLHIEGMHCFRPGLSGLLGNPRFPKPSDTGNRMGGSPTPSFRNVCVASLVFVLPY